MLSGQCRLSTNAAKRRVDQHGSDQQPGPDRLQQYTVTLLTLGVSYPFVDSRAKRMLCGSGIASGAPLPRVHTTVRGWEHTYTFRGPGGRSRDLDQVLDLLVNCIHRDTELTAPI